MCAGLCVGECACKCVCGSVRASVCVGVCVLLKSCEEAANVTDVSQLIAAAASPNCFSANIIRPPKTRPYSSPRRQSHEFLMSRCSRSSSCRPHGRRQGQSQRQRETWLDLTHCDLTLTCCNRHASIDIYCIPWLSPAPLPILHLPLTLAHRAKLNVEPQSDWHQMNSPSSLIGFSFKLFVHFYRVYSESSMCQCMANQFRRPVCLAAFLLKTT